MGKLINGRIGKKKPKPAKSTLTTTKCSFLKDWQKKERNKNGFFLGCPKDTKNKE